MAPDAYACTPNAMLKTPEVLYASTRPIASSAYTAPYAMPSVRPPKKLSTYALPSPRQGLHRARVARRAHGQLGVDVRIGTGGGALSPRHPVRTTSSPRFDPHPCSYRR